MDRVLSKSQQVWGGPGCDFWASQAENITQNYNVDVSMSTFHKYS